jgi:hypothetical protein
MNLIDKIKKLSETTNSPEVKEICENFIAGNSVSTESHQKLMESVNEMEPNTAPAETGKDQDLIQSLRQSEIEKSKSIASSLMENWRGLDSYGRAIAPKGVYGSYKDGFEQNKKEEASQEEVLSLLESHSEKDASVAALFTSQKAENLGLKSALETFANSGIGHHPAVKSLITKHKHILESNNVPEYLMVESFIQEYSAYDWDASVKSEISKISENASKLKNEIEVSKAIYLIKSNDPTSFYKPVVESLNSWLVSSEKSVGLLAKDLARWQFNPVVQNLLHTLKVNESTGGLHLTKKQGESEVNKVYSPVLTRDTKLVFQMSGSLFEASESGVRRLKSQDIESLPEDFKSLLESFNREYVKLNENGVNFYISRSSVKIQESNDTPEVVMNGVNLRFKDTNELARILHLEFASIPGVNAAAVTKDVINVYESFDKIVELDIAKNISSRVYEGLSINLIKWKNQIYVQRINEGMKEDSFLKASGSQAMKIVKDLLRFDISEGLSQFLEGESKIKAVMINDRNKVIENISIVENEINKLETLMTSNKMYESSPQVKAAHSQLTSELTALKEKWSAINAEIEKFENGYEDLEMVDEGKYSIGDFVRVKESGDNGKVISVDSSSGSYVVMMNDGKTGEYRVDEIEDMDAAIQRSEEDNEKKAGEEPKKSSEETEGEEVKESQDSYAEAPGTSKLDKEDHSEEKRAKKLMAQAPKSVETQEEKSKYDAEKQSAAQLAEAPDGKEKSTDFEVNKEIGYNLHEEKDLSKEDPEMAEAPKSSSQDKSGEKFIDDLDNQELAKAPGKEGDIDFEANKEMGYNLEEKADIAKTDDGMAEAPKSNSQDKSGEEFIEDTKDMNLAEAPGKEGEIDIKVNSEMGYNLDESDEVKKN